MADLERKGSDEPAPATRATFLRWLRRIGCLVLVIGALFFTRHCYDRWRIVHLEKQARAFFDRRDYISAVLVCRHLLQVNPKDLEACRVMGETAQLARRAEAIDWYRQLVSLQPTTPNRLALATAAISFAEYKVAANTLSDISPADRGTARFHEICGALAVAQKQNGSAAEHFRQAERLNPKDERTKLNRAVSELTSGGTAADHARQDLVQLATSPVVKIDAVRTLLTEAIARKDTDAQVKWIEQLRTQAAATFQDQMLCLESAAQRQVEENALRQVEAIAQKSPADAATLIVWMNRHGHAQEALDWAQTLPQEIAAAQPLPLAIAESYSCAQQWSALRQFVEQADWKSGNALRLTIASHAARRLSDPALPSSEAISLWDNAVKAAGNDSLQLLAMAEMCHGWGYDEQAEKAWWLVAAGSDKADVALSALQQHYLAQRNARGLLRVAQRALQLNPDDAVAANNCASLGLLLNNDSNSRRLAEKLHDQHPQNEAFAATYAFALHTEGRTADALKIFSQFKPEFKKVPAISAYYVVLLVEHGDLDAARSFLSFAQQAKLLPEEEKLLSEAAKKLTVAHS